MIGRGVASIAPETVIRQLGTVSAWGGRGVVVGADPDVGLVVAEDARFTVGGIPDGLTAVFGVALPDGAGPFPVTAEFERHPRRGDRLVAISIRFDEPRPPA